MSARPYETTPVSPDARALLDRYQLDLRLPFPGVEILTPRLPIAARSRTRIIRRLNDEPQIDFAGRLLVDASTGQPVVYTEHLFVKFTDRVSPARCRAILRRHSLRILEEPSYAINAYSVAAPRNSGLNTFRIAEDLLNDTAVEFAHPELIRQSRVRRLFQNQWHLGRVKIAHKWIDAHANVKEAWKLTRGSGTTIAVIDNGFDIDHEEFQPFQDKIVAPRDMMRGDDDPRPGNFDNHGTACAGVACANGNVGAAGVAPEAKLMPIRLRPVLGSNEEAAAFAWAADNGADVISCSWGPEDGDWSNPDDPRHEQVVALPDATRLALDYAATKGREGRGCVIVFAAGNGNERVDNDGYASYEKVIAVAACNDRGKRSYYSDYGRAIWCAFPSNDVQSARPATPGIWTTDRSGAPGYNDGDVHKGDSKGNYTNSFGGTSSACPGVAGVAALILSANPNLTREQVCDLIRQTCDRIDESGGAYDATGHSAYYGYGRVNAHAAVLRATR